jgi:putative flippase GtrA
VRSPPPAALLLTLLVEVVHADLRLGQALALAAPVPLSFALSKRWAFRSRPDSV